MLQPTFENVFSFCNYVLLIHFLILHLDEFVPTILLFYIFTVLVDDEKNVLMFS